MKISREGLIILFFGSIAIIAFIRSWIALTLLTGLIFLSIPFISLVWAMFTIRSVEIRRELPDEAVSGEQLFASYRLTCHSMFPAYGVRLTDFATRGYISGLDVTASSGVTLRESISFIGVLLKYFGVTLIEEVDLFEEAFHSAGLDADFPLAFPPLTRGKWMTRNVPLVFPVRGKYRVGPGQIETGDPLGIFRFTVNVKGFSEILVLPTWTSLKFFPMGGSSRILRDENISQDREGASSEFLGVREYRENDPLKLVHWKLTARHNQLMVKQFVKQVESSWGVILDLRKGFNAGKGKETSLEYMVECAASLLELFDKEKIPHILALAGDDITTSENLKGERMFDEELRMLAAGRNDGTLHLHQRAINISEKYPYISWVLITARNDEDILQSINALSKFGAEVLVIHVNFNSFLTEDISPASMKKWRKMWGVEVEDFENEVLGVGAKLHQINKGDDQSLLFFNA
ncbi:DUF58 domain-containing protein [bacterium]|nr:DUF58 domain-containing protein [bacterium]MBU1024548.1 DUF58 domain-containing protein [bacterium]